MGYPDYEHYGYSFGRAELNANKKIYTAISNVSFSQPTTSAGVMGTRPWPILETEGNVGLGSGTITFSDEAERVLFLEGLGDGWRTKRWGLIWTLVSEGRPAVKLACIACRVLDNPVAHGQGDEALGGDVAFSFLSHTVNGKAPHKGMPKG